MRYIGLDIGTSGCKAAVVGAEGNIIFKAGREYKLETPEAGYVQLDPRRIWLSVEQTLSQLAPFCAGVKGLALSGIGESFVLLDERDAPLNSFITYLDERCADEPARIVSVIGEEELYKITSLTPHSMYSLCKILWIRRNQPEIWKRAKKLMLFSEYFTYRMTGNRMTDYSTASRTMLFDAEKHEWSERILGTFDVPKALLADIEAPGTPIGPMLPEISLKLGLPKGITVYLGCHDQIAACLGAGLCEPGDTVVGEGSSESINMVADGSLKYRSNELIKSRVCTEPYLTKDRIIVPIGFLCYGTSLKWYVENLESELLNSDRANVFASLDKKCAAKTDVFFFPYLSRMNVMHADSRARGAFLGITVSTSREEMYRAVLEGLQFESRGNFEIFERLGLPAKHVVAVGGMTRSDLIMQLKADVLNMDINASNTSEAGILGLAMICAVARGDVRGYPQAIKSFAGSEKPFISRGGYDEKYREYNRLSAGLKALYSR